MRRILCAVWLAACAWLAVGCGTITRTGPPADVLIQTDVAFARAAAARGAAAAFRQFAAPDAMILPNGANPVHGPDQIFQLMRQNSGELTWTPRGARISKAADLGYTWGEYQFREMTTQPGSQVPVRYGKYLTVWARQPDGQWKFVMDVGNSSPPPN